MIALSAVIITKNEAHNIEGCLDSVERVCEEIIVVDAFSEDHTPSICKRRNVRFFQRPFDSFAAQKKAALALSTHAHVLALDADERLSEELVASILWVKKTGFQYTGYQMRRLSFYKDRPIRVGGWYPNPQLRLWEKQHGSWGNQLVHEYVMLTPHRRCGMLKGDLLHDAYQNPTQMQRKALRYSGLYAEQYRFRKRVTPIGVAVKAFIAFWRSYLLRGGFRAGYVGLLIARNTSDNTFYKYIKLMEANRTLSATLIVTTYNYPEALKEVLNSVRRQSLLPMEVIIANEGSSKETQQLIKNEQGTFPVPLQHCWQKDEGVRASRSRNQALAAAKGEYIILIDGNIVLHKHFLRNQQRYCRKGWLLESAPWLLNKAQTRKVLQQGWAQLSAWQKACIRGAEGIYLPMLSWLFFRHIRGSYGLHSCLISFWKQDAAAINGLEEALRKDNDFVARIQQHGVRIKKLKRVSLGYHLQHKHASHK